MTKKLWTILAAAATTLAACDSATGPETGGSGDATMQVSAIGDDAPSQSAQPQGGGAVYAVTTAEGTVTFRARVYAQAGAGQWVELTNRAAQQATVDASGRAGAVLFTSSRVNAGAYGRVRVEFEQVNASLSGSLQVSTGLLSGNVSVDGEGDGKIVVERQVSASASAGATSRLLINLNTSTWMNQASATSRTVSEAAFRAAVAVTAS
jgi:hypothetical protein